MVQMAADRQKFYVLGQWSGPNAPPQQLYASTTGELYAQRRVRQEFRRIYGRLAAICWCDNKTGVKQATKADGADVDQKHLRWMADIESDGSQLKHISARSSWMRIADGLSRSGFGVELSAHPDLTAELANRARQIREFRVEDLLDTLEPPGEIQVNSLPGQQLPVELAGPVTEEIGAWQDFWHL